MSEKKIKKVAFPRINMYNVCAKYFIENGMGAQCIMQPPMTRRTLEIGTKLSPDYVCAPFKSTLGSLIDAIESGADTVIMLFGLCRLGYYGELQQQIIHDLGYEVDFINFSDYTTGNFKDYFKAVKRINPSTSLAKITKYGLEMLKMAEYIDEIEEEYYENCGFEINKGMYKKSFERFMMSLDFASSKRDIEDAYRTVKHEFAAILVNKPSSPIRVGVIGEFFTVMDPFSNLDLEQKLCDMGVEVHRWMNVTNRMLHYKGKNLSIQISDYTKYEMGPTSTANIWAAKKWADQGYDGLIHIKSSGCTPEIDIMPVLQNISRDYKIPVLYVSFDSQTSDTGLETRLEAFYDMLNMGKKVVR